jgi:hypothetical protein
MGWENAVNEFEHRRPQAKPQCAAENVCVSMALAILLCMHEPTGCSKANRHE